MKKITQKILKGLLRLVLLVLILVVASFTPTLWLQTSSMTELKGHWVNVYYEAEEEAAKDIFYLAEEKAGGIIEKLGFSSVPKINMYIYDKQSGFQTKKYGWIGPLLKLHWYIGDNRGTNVLLTSPANPGKEHSYHSIREASIHEMVHAYNSILNPKMPLWLNEGSALFLTNDEPSQIDRHDQIPTFEQTQTSNPIEFSNMGGYDFAYTYLEFLNQKYGWDKVLSLLETSDYAKSIGENPERIYDQWLKFLELEYKINQ